MPAETLNDMQRNQHPDSIRVLVGPASSGIKPSTEVFFRAVSLAERAIKRFKHEQVTTCYLLLACTCSQLDKVLSSP